MKSDQVFNSPKSINIQSPQNAFQKINAFINSKLINEQTQQQFQRMFTNIKNYLHDQWVDISNLKKLQVSLLHKANQPNEDQQIQNQQELCFPYMCQIRQKLGSSIQEKRFLNCLFNDYGIIYQDKQQIRVEKVAFHQKLNICPNHNRIIRNQPFQCFLIQYQCEEQVKILIIRTSVANYLTKNDNNEFQLRLCCPKSELIRQVDDNHQIQNLPIKTLSELIICNNVPQIIDYLQQKCQLQIDILQLTIHLQKVTKKELEIFAKCKKNKNCIINCQFILDYRKQSPENVIQKFNLFRLCFPQVKQITIEINQPFQRQEKIVSSLKKIEIHFIINLQQSQQEKSFPKILKFLEKFETVKSLAFKGAHYQPAYHYQLRIIQQFEKMQQSLRKILKKNKITNLYLQNCKNFPFLPNITNLQSLTIKQVEFRQIFNNSQIRFCLNRFIQENQSLLDLRLTINQDGQSNQSDGLSSLSFVSIKDCLFNQLQYFSFQRNSKCQSSSVLPSIKNIFQNPSKIKILCLNNINGYLLNLISGKLNHLTQLFLSKVDCENNFLLEIPSKVLQSLRIFQYKQITVGNLEQIEQKWPSLLNIIIRKCNHSKGLCPAINISEMKKSTNERLKKIVAIDGGKISIQSKPKFAMP